MFYTCQYPWRAMFVFSHAIFYESRKGGWKLAVFIDWASIISVCFGLAMSGAKENNNNKKKGIRQMARSCCVFSLYIYCQVGLKLASPFLLAWHFAWLEGWEDAG